MKKKKMKIMNKSVLTALSLTVLFFLTSFHSFAQNLDRTEYCPITEGIQLKYANYDKNGEIKSYYAFEVTKIEGTVANGHFIFEQEIFDKNDEPLFKENLIPMDITTNDSLTISRMKGLSRIMKIQDDVSKGDESSIPSVLNVGMKIPDGKIELHVDKITAYILTQDRKVIDQKTITTKAGTFDCYLIKEKQITKAVGAKTELVETWYAKGIGTVKQTVYDKKGRLKQSQELISLSIRN